MNTAPLLLPFSPAQFGTFEAAPMPLPTPAILPAQAPALLPGAAATTATLPAAFANVLALAIQPADADAKKTDASDASTDDSAPVESSDEHKPTPTAPDLTGIANTVNASMIVRDMGALQPAFRAKLERVISRMSDEYGHTVTVAETYRSQARQDQLLQQGRTTSGPIVTWTSHSLHTQGRAADLLVDGKWNNPEGFQHLQQIAAEEGLSTLGTRDPGHLELREDSLTTIANMAQITEVSVSPANIASPVKGQPVAPTLPAAPILPAAPVAPVAVAAQATDLVAFAPVAPAAQVARVASVAQVAQVAQVAPVAQVAQVAQVTLAAPVIHAAPAAHAAPTTQVAQVASSPSHHESSDQNPNPDRRDRRDGQDKPAASAPPIAAPKAQIAQSAISAPPTASVPPVVTASPLTINVGETRSVAELGTAARAAAVMAMQDSASSQPASHMTLQLDNGTGGLDRIRVALRGNAVGATIDMRDQGAANEVASNIHQLATALQSRGLDSDSLRVRVAGSIGGTPAPDIARLVAASGDSAAPSLGTLFAQASSSSSRSRGDAQSSGRQSQQENTRQRSRKDQQGDPQ